MLPVSTCVITETLPIERIEVGMLAALAELGTTHWAGAAQDIMTTDTVAKAASRRINLRGKPVHMTGIAKGAGMIRPNMATMLGFIATDAAIAPTLMRRLVQDGADTLFNVSLSTATRRPTIRRC